MRVLLFASGDFAVPTLRSLADPNQAGHSVVAVVTQPDRGSGRGRKAKPTPTKEAAVDLGLDVFEFENVNDEEAIRTLQPFEADIGLAIAFGQKIGAGVRSLFRHECVNLHASLLPKYRGAAPFQWAVINGEERTGVTVFRLVDRMDAGPIFTTRWTLIKPEERACELHDRLAGIGVDAVRACLDRLESEPDWQPAPQDDTEATRAPKLSKEDGTIRFDVPAHSLASQINGLWDWPGAKCVFTSDAQGKTERVTLALARKADVSKPAEAPGVIDARRYVATSDGYIEILEIKPDGARTMSFQDFVNGRHVKPGDRFSPIQPDSSHAE